MKLPWDREYLKISFHVVVTILVIYIIGLIITNINIAADIFSRVIGTVMLVLRPLLIALIFAYITNPAVEFIQKKTEIFFPARQSRDARFTKRMRGTSILYLLILLALVLLGRIAVQKIGSSDATELAQSINDYIEGFRDMIVLFHVKLAEMGVLESLEDFIQTGINSIASVAQNAVMNMADTVSKAGGWVVNVGIGLTTAFYLLMEKEKILYYSRDILDVFLPRRISEMVKGICHDINSIFSGYIGGQVMDAIIMAGMVSVSFYIVGIKYAIMIGIISGFSNLIPYVGAFVAFILSVIVGLLSGAPVKALYAVIIVLILQQIDGMFIVPKVVGKSVELHPVLVILSLSVFGSLFGIVGMIVAVPCTAIIKLFLLRFYYKKREERDLPQI